ncbi:aldo/keto reductase [Allobranchiibius huperziae]|uniref:Aryl-alcohol dehydrogenase (NADP+) n=1 Tax=Allobranchiibius huperziae TaxID=1874116 RepID=A0A853DG01_9MICO|nr:aldo/keto reductase [Allobranchiibius huperziae]NYJ73811.1 aryl-alcohol dehydrogenase (NADP+) [Allobranchiibius huperziae]
MKYTRLGTTGLQVSRIALGCMSYGEPQRGAHPWSLDEETSRPFFRQAIEAGVTFFDTANVYSAGSSEEITGRALKDFARREEVVIATKLNGRMGPGPNGAGLSRGAVMTQIDESLRRLGTDYVDLYQIHRWDPETPIEETVEALHDVVQSGKARYVGASSMWAWQFAKALHVADANGWTRFVTMQDHYNLLQREEEREMFPLLADEGVGSIPWSPLARGKLTRDWDATSTRSETDEFGKSLYRDEDRTIVDEVAKVADERGVTRAQVALAWVLRNPVVSSPIVGATKAAHLDDAIAAVDLELTDAECDRLEASYTVREPAGSS